MSLGELLKSTYSALEGYSAWILVGASIFPALGTLVAWIGSKGKTDRDGRAIASVVIGTAILFFVAEIAALGVAWSALGKSPLEANVLLLVAPFVCLVASLAGMRLVFPLGELSSVRTFRDIGLFVVACAAALWLLSKFRGWGIIFFGGVAQLVTIGLFSWALLKRLYGRAFGGSDRTTPVRSSDEG